MQRPTRPGLRRPALAGLPASMAAAEMAQHLRRVSGADALCFAQAMHEGSAWANEAWGEFWAEVVRQV